MPSKQRMNNMSAKRAELFAWTVETAVRGCPRGGACRSKMTRERGEDGGDVPEGLSLEKLDQDDEQKRAIAVPWRRQEREMVVGH